MSDQDIPTSGSRWEPATGDLTTTADEARPSRGPRRLPVRGAAAAAGVGLVLAGGVGGFAIGHAMAGTGVPGGTVTDPSGVPNGGTGGRPDFRDDDRPAPGGVRPDGTAPDGIAPGGTVPDGTAPGDTSPDTGDGGTA